jgi:DtxR family transcriptional regulator, Mn-dependent transcriptional regulator
MELTERAEEILETLWIKTEEEKQSRVPARDLQIEGAPVSAEIEELRAAGCIVGDQEGFALTGAGRPLAENVVRRHRLAERLLADVLDAWNETNHAKACKFEHLLDRGLDDSICILLGHPKVCPHGKPIPPGKCCREMKDSASKLVSPLSRLGAGQTGRVAYVHARKQGQLQKLTAMGILPGAPVSVVQTFPAYVFQAGQTEFAVDEEIADAIYVRLNEAGVTAGGGAPSPDGGRRGRRRRWGWGRHSN